MKLKVIIVVLFVFLIICSCECAFTTANLQDVKMCDQLSEDVCIDDYPVFFTDTPRIYVSATLANASEGTEVSFGWYSVDDERYLIDEVTVTTEGSGTTWPMFSSLSKPYDGWPPGEYEVVISIVGHDEKTITRGFTVE